MATASACRALGDRLITTASPSPTVAPGSVRSTVRPGRGRPHRSTRPRTLPRRAIGQKRPGDSLLRKRLRQIVDLRQAAHGNSYADGTSKTVVFCVSLFKTSLGASRPPVGARNASRGVHETCQQLVDGRRDISGCPLRFQTSPSTALISVCRPRSRPRQHRPATTER